MQDLKLTLVKSEQAMTSDSSCQPDLMIAKIRCLFKQSRGPFQGQKATNKRTEHFMILGTLLLHKCDNSYLDILMLLLAPLIFLEK